MNTVRRMLFGLTREHPRVSTHQISRFVAALEVAFENEGAVINARMRQVLDPSRDGRRGTCCWRPNGNDRRHPHSSPLLLGVLNLGSIPLTEKEYLCLFKVLSRFPIFKEVHLHAGSVTTEVGHALLELQAEQVELSHLRGVASTKSARLKRKLGAIKAFSHSGGDAFARRANLKQKLRGASKDKAFLAKIRASAAPGDGRGGGSGEEKGVIGSPGSGGVVAAAAVVVLASNGGADGGRGAEGAAEGAAEGGVAEGAAGPATEGVGGGEETKGGGVNDNDGNDDSRPSRTTRAETVSQHAPVWLIQTVNFTKGTMRDQIQRARHTKVGKLANVVAEDAVLDTSAEFAALRKNIESASTLCYVENCVLESARVFADIDTDGNGTINRAELLKAMKEQYRGITMPMDDVTRVFDYIDVDHNGLITEGEFLNAVARRCKNSIRVKDVRDELHKIVPPNTMTLNPNSDIMQVCNM
jgi:hypothetical protein